MTRTDPPLAGSEAETLLGFLDYHRDTLRLKTDGLDAAQLDQRLPPSTITLGGLLKHLAYVEDWWFNQVYADNPAPEPWASVDWRPTATGSGTPQRMTPPTQLRDLYDETVAASDRIVHEALAHPGAMESLSRRTFRKDPTRRHNLRWILVHMIEEYCRHNGHADLIRESIDGSWASSPPSGDFGWRSALTGDFGGRRAGGSSTENPSGRPPRPVAAAPADRPGRRRWRAR